MSKHTPHDRGITIRSFLLAFLCLVVLSAIINIYEIADGSGYFEALSTTIFALPVPAMLIFTALTLIASFLFVLSRVRFVTRNEMLFIFLTLFIAAPFMSLSFWTRAIGTMGYFSQRNQFEKMDTLNPKLWPRGENIIEGVFEQDSKQYQVESVGSVEWKTIDYGRSESGKAAVLKTQSPGQRSAVRIHIPVGQVKETGLRRGEPYIISVLAKAQNIEDSDTHYYCHLFLDDAEEYNQEIFSSRRLEKQQFLHPQGFIKYGRYDLRIPPSTQREVILEFGIEGDGSALFVNPEYYSVSALENSVTGLQSVSASEYARFSDVEKERLNIVVRPESMLSIEGLKFIVTSHILWREWQNPLIAWGSFILLILVATFAIACIMRKQWVQNERNPMPLAYIPNQLLGNVDSDPMQAGIAPIWKSRAMWLGFGLTFFWCMMRLWGAYNTSVPDMNIRVPLAPYFEGPFGSKMFGTYFKISALFLGIALLMELNILMTLVIGFFLFRFQLGLGEINGWASSVQGYPLKDEQMIGSYLMYGVLILVLTRRYLWQVARKVIGLSPDSDDEPMRYRTAAGILLFSTVNVAFWGQWVGLSLQAVYAVFFLMLMFCFVSMKIRTECGTPMGRIGPLFGFTVLPFIGGMSFLGADGFVFAIMFFLLVANGGFYLLPGLQIESIQLGRRSHLPARQLLIAVVLGVFGGIIIGGWGHLTVTYGLGLDGVGNNLPYTANFAGKPYTKEMNRQDKRFEESLKEQSEKETAKSEADDKKDFNISADTKAYLFGAGATALVTILRQLFAGFSFHPIGIILGPSRMLDAAWASILMAWFIRLMVLKLGGAITVRSKLAPFAVGVFLAAVLSHGLLFLINAGLMFFQPGGMREYVFF
jgi:hypothetical protein